MGRKKKLDLNAWWEQASNKERGQFIEALADKMGRDAFYDMLVEMWGEDKIRKGLERLRMH